MTAPDPAVVNAHIGRRIRRRRKDYCISQKRLARAVGLSCYQSIQGYERGRTSISAGMLTAIAYQLGVPIQYFFDGLGTETKQRL